MDFTLDNLTPDMRLAIWIIVGARVLIWAFYANTVRRTMAMIAPENRFFRPNQAWLLILPFFNIYWNFVTVRGLTGSLHNEFYDRKLAEEERPGLSTGLAYCWTFLLSHIPFPPFVLMTVMMLSVIYFIQYWVKANNFRILLREHNAYLKQQSQDETT